MRASADRAAGDLIALHGRRQVLEHQHEVARGRVPVGVVAVRRADVDGGGHLPVEGDLALVVAELHARGPAHVVGRRQLGHDAGRRAGAVAALGVGQPVADAHPDLPGADPLGVGRHHAEAEDVAQPGGGDVVGAHGPGTLPAARGHGSRPALRHLTGTGPTRPVPSPPVQRYGFLLRRKWVILTVLVVIGTFAMVWAGFWQLRRLHGRQAVNHEIRSPDGGRR